MTESATLSYIDWTIFVGYLTLVFAMGIWFTREQHSNEDFFLAGRNMHWMPVGLSMFAGTFSSLSFVGLPREAAYSDFRRWSGWDVPIPSHAVLKNHAWRYTLEIQLLEFDPAPNVENITVIRGEDKSETKR